MINDNGFGDGNNPQYCHEDYLEIANMQVLKISDADDFIIVVMMVISKMIMVWVMVTILNIVSSKLRPPILLQL